MKIAADCGTERTLVGFRSATPAFYHGFFKETLKEAEVRQFYFFLILLLFQQFKFSQQKHPSNWFAFPHEKVQKFRQKENIFLIFFVNSKFP